MSQYVISLPASGDLRAIADYFAVENVEVGERLLREFNQRCKQLASFPVVTVWLQSKNDGIFRFITLKPKKE